MPCMKTKLLIATAVCSATAVPAFAQNVTDLGSVTTVGVSGAHDEVVTAKSHTPTIYGMCVDHGNKMTVTSGVIYNFRADLTQGKTKYKNSSIQGQAGYHVSVADSILFDALGGLEYGKFTIKTDRGDMKFKTPSIKAVIGAHYLASSETSSRAELGYSYNSDGKLKDKSNNTKHNLKHAGNPYAELSVFNSSTGFPIYASVYHTKPTYKFDKDDNELKGSQS